MLGFAVCLLQASALRLGRVDQPLSGLLQSGSTYFQKGLADLDLTAAEVDATTSAPAAPAVSADVSMEAQAIAAIAMANNMTVAAAKAKLESANLIVAKVKAKEQERYDAARIAVAEGITEAEAMERIHAAEDGKKAPKPAKENPVKAALGKAAPAKKEAAPAKAEKKAPTPAKENPVKAALAKAAPAKAAPAKAEPAKAAPAKAEPAKAEKATKPFHEAKKSVKSWHRGRAPTHHKAKAPAHQHSATAKLDAATRKGHQMVSSKMDAMTKRH
jgi:hypothetical protein